MDYDFKVGDKVRHELGYGNFEVSEVIGITPKGYVKVKCGNNSFLTFYSDGFQRGGDPWSRHRIKPITQEDYEEIDRDRLANYLMNKVTWKSLPINRLRRIWKIVTDSPTADEKLTSGGAGE